MTISVRPKVPYSDENPPFEDLFMEIVSMTPIERRDAELDGIIEGFVSTYGALRLAVNMSLVNEDSENFGCTVGQVAYDVVRHHLTQHWLEMEDSWWVISSGEYAGPYLYNADLYSSSHDRYVQERKLAGPFGTENEAVKWAEDNGVELEMC